MATRLSWVMPCHFAKARSPARQVACTIARPSRSCSADHRFHRAKATARRRRRPPVLDWRHRTATVDIVSRTPRWSCCQRSARFSCRQRKYSSHLATQRASNCRRCSSVPVPKACTCLCAKSSSASLGSIPRTSGGSLVLLVDGVAAIWEADREHSSVSGATADTPAESDEPLGDTPRFRAVGGVVCPSSWVLGVELQRVCPGTLPYSWLSLASVSTP
eukprot:scaffold260996_cov33-Tisochrysis_lutea.AAC.3